MASFKFKTILLPEIEKSFSSQKAEVLEAVAYGYSNKSIADEYKVSIKAVEKSLTALNKKLESGGKLFSSRIRVIVHLIVNDLIDYKFIEDDINIQLGHQKRIQDLNEDLKQTLLLSAVGLSNDSIARLFKISKKRIEQRLAQLFDAFAIDTRNLSVENPRVLLFISSYLRGNIDKSQLKRLYKETKRDRLERIIEDPESFLIGLEKDGNVIG